MSNEDFTPTLNTDVLINHLHQSQVDLVLLIEYLARQPNPVLSNALLISIGHLHHHLAYLTPSMTRH
jgi:hypothetical protein